MFRTVLAIGRDRAGTALPPDKSIIEDAPTLPREHLGEAISVSISASVVLAAPEITPDFDPNRGFAHLKHKKTRVPSSNILLSS